MVIRIAPFLTVLALAACSSPEEIGEKVGVKPETVAATGETSATATASTRAEGQAVKEETDLYRFALSWPKEVSAIPALTARLEAEGRAARKQLIEEAKADRKSAEADKDPYHAHSFEETWQVVASLPGWLSLTDDFYGYSGGAHGIYGRESLVWDKQASAAHKGIDLFASPAVLQAALGDKLCDRLNAERLGRRGADYQFDAGGTFDDCPGVEEASVIVGSSNGRTFDRIGIWYGPYVAGPYAEGDYELNFPVDANVLDAVKPAYRSAFSIKR